ncbi:ATP-binding cassette subfamily C protein CydD [Conyzicola nivalis]|uniref:ATP-binding cassette subfamily C protein CydD n=1 Tax=Conyzicola nivalis TaxID=1477021 RepID=A0ABV2QKT9_9MICO
MSAGPIDPRLLKYASASRWFLLAGGVVGFLQTLSIVGAAWFAAVLIVGVLDGESLASLGPQMAAFAGVVVVRAVLVWLLDVLAVRGAARVKSQLRMRVVAALGRLGPAWIAERNSAAVTTVVAQGLDALDGYFAKYLPQLILTAVATPIIVLVLLGQDLTTAIVVLVTLPLIPLFMVLIGWATQAVQKRQWSALTRLASGFLDVVDGLSTLKIFGRQHRQVARIETVTEEYRARTMAVLRVSFISGFVLELAGSLSVAVVAVSIGLRLVDGSIGLAVGLFVLLLTPEAYLPLRQVGAQFHAAADGVAAADEVFEILEAAPEDLPEASAAPVDRASTLTVDDLRVSYGDRTVIDGLSVGFAPGRVTAVAGPSGAGKSTLVAAVLGFVAYSGSIRYGDRELEPGAARDLVAWAGQRPSLMAGTVAENIALGAGTVDEATLREAMRFAAAELIDPWQTLGVNGAGLSGGQAQRVSLARAFYRAMDRGCPVLILDEPSSALDPATESELILGLQRFAATGVAVVVVSHRTALLDAVDSVIELRPRAAVVS